MNPENGFRILEILGFLRKSSENTFCHQIPHPFRRPPPPAKEIATSAALRACAARCARCARAPPLKKKARTVLRGVFWGRSAPEAQSKLQESTAQAPPPRGASAKFMAWAILNGKSLAWANEKYEKSSSGRDFHPKNLLAWTIFNGKFLAWASEKHEKSSPGLDFPRKWPQKSPVQVLPPRQNSWPGPF